MKVQNAHMSLEDRFEAQYMPEPNSGCWLWCGAVTGCGYGAIRDKYANKRAHRVAWELYRGPIPEGYHVDHLCRNTVCVNPAHLEPVPPKENARRGANGVLKTHCRRGHELAGDNLYMWRGKRLCRTCKSRRWRDSPARKRRMERASYRCPTRTAPLEERLANE